MSDATYGTVQVGRLTLREIFSLQNDVNAQTGVRTVVITGEESTPPLTEAALRQRAEDVMTMRDMIMPITWTNKSDSDGFYIVVDVSVGMIDYIQDVLKFTWSIRARRIGPDNSAEIESRLTGITRQNDFNKTGSKWHAPAIGAYGYYTGSTRPASSVARTSEDGNVTTFLGVPDDANPRWSIPAGSYRNGRARIKVDGIERTGTNLQDGGTWELGNGIIRVTPGVSGALVLGVYNGATYEDKIWNVSVGATATSIGTYDAMSVIRNDFEMATLRLVKDMAPGRSVLDLTIRRGSRFVEGYLETDVSTTLAFGLSVAEGATAPASGGYVVATSNDGSGNKAIVGSARLFSAQTGRTGIQKTSAVSMDFFAGSVYNGTGAATGDAATDLRDQYIGAMAEMSMAVLR